MNSWIPLWTSTVQSTLWEEAPHVRVMFLTMLMVGDPDHVVRLPFRRLVKLANLSKDVEESVRLARDAVETLSRPDSKSIDDQEFEGRRIEEVNDGWLILNGEKYEEERRLLAARIRKSQKQRERRELARGNGAGKPLPGEVAYQRALDRGDEKEAERIVTASLPQSAVVPAPQPVAKPVVTAIPSQVQKAAVKVGLGPMFPPAPAS